MTTENPAPAITLDRYYPEMPPALPGETSDQYTDRLTGADRTGRRPYDHTRNRQCSIGYHDECSDPDGETCECPCHTTPPGTPRHDDPRPFLLVRDEDVTGISGTGVVAQGVEFSDGVAALRWLSDWPTSVVFHDEGVQSVQTVHGHGGKTRIVWINQVPAAPAETPTPAGDADLTERLAARVHEAWMKTKLDQGVTSRPSADGEEQMVPYERLSEPIKDLDRSTVLAVLSAIAEEGLSVAPAETPEAPESSDMRALEAEVGPVKPGETVASEALKMISSLRVELRDASTGESTLRFTLDRITALVERSAGNGDLIPASAVRAALASPTGGEGE